MKQQYTLSFKGGENPPDCLITGIEFEDKWHVEIWNVRKNYHQLRPFESDLNEKQERLKMLKESTPPAPSKEETEKKIKDIEGYLSFWRKYTNKRYSYSKEEFNEKFEILKQL